ncbi:putative dehydrogenase [Glaciihabitans tibetensis]|uniref:Putative dehydrogenase n=1 Tax=Glaciihabitans tibetensis TaxID=1266600 RepID=A0A2T0VE20_9MICO|nr:Gfo/Idh/MocA family oxidoreductase [Glaciihabitans tibetensis]PRY68425.1 putative dehydrogenase [Glaciihabitans tibetensis]
MSTTRWAILGPGTISGNFADSLEHSQLGVLHAVGSSNAERAAQFARDRNAPFSGTYQDILSRDDIDAVYIGTVHTTHAELAIAALEAGKAVLCEKPVTPTPEATAQVLAAAQASQRPFLEAYKYRFGPLADELRAILSRGEIGTLERLEASGGFAAPEHTGRLFDPALAGGAILDMGGYPVSLAVAFAEWAGIASASATITDIDGELGAEGVDVWARADVTMGGFVATVRTAIVSDLPDESRLFGSDGWIELPNVWGSRQLSSGSAIIHRTGEEPRRVEVDVVDPMAAEADAVSLALADGRAEIPEMTWAETSTVADILAEWRRGLS